MDQARRSKKGDVLPANTGDPRFAADDEGPPKPPAEWTAGTALWADVTFNLGVGRELDVVNLELTALLKLVAAALATVRHPLRTRLAGRKR